MLRRFLLMPTCASSAFVIGTLMLAFSTAQQLAAQESGQASESAMSRPATDATALGVLAGRVKNDLVYRAFLEGGRALTQRDDVMTPAEISAAIKAAGRRADSAVPATPTCDKPEYAALAKSTLLFGTVYDCGRCSNLHASVAGGVVISADGLAITNYHVLDRDGKGTEEVFAMTFDGQTHPIKKVLSASKQSDVVLVQLGGDGPFFPAPIAQKMPLPLEPVTVLSHPKNQFFVLTQGVVSRHVTLNSRRGDEWTEITADYGAGSSGSGVFNSQGEVVGLVSRNFPIIRLGRGAEPQGAGGDNEQGKLQPPEGTTGNSFVEIVLRRCVTLDAIRARFAE